MKRPKIPDLIVEVENESYVVGDLMASEYEWMSGVTGGEICNRQTLVQGIENRDPQAWRALLRVMRKRGGDAQNYSDIDLPIDAAEFRYVDEDGQEIEPSIVKKPCEKHDVISMVCDDCTIEPVVDGEFNPVWNYVGDPERTWSPTRRAKGQPSPVPSLSAD